LIIVASIIVVLTWGCREGDNPTYRTSEQLTIRRRAGPVTSGAASPNVRVQSYCSAGA